MSQRRIWIGLRLRTFTGWHLSSVKTLLSIYVLSAVTELRCRPVVSCFAKWYFQIVNWISVWIRTFFDHLSRSVFIPIILFVGLVSSITGFRLWTDFRMWPDFASDRTSFCERISSAIWPDFRLLPDYAYARTLFFDRISSMTEFSSVTGFLLWPDFASDRISLVILPKTAWTEIFDFD